MLSIIGLASVLVVPNVTNMSGRNFQVQVREAHSLLNYARRMAVVTGQPTVAAFAISRQQGAPEEPRSVRAVHENRRTWTSEGVAVTYRDSTDREIEVEDEVEITFYPEGGSTGGELILDQGDQRAILSVDPFSGRVETRYDDEL